METLPKDVTSVSKYEIEPFKQGRRVGCYLLGKTLGEGSFAKVKEGLHIITGERVAVKIIDKKRAREDRYISKNLRREARIHQLVRHPNIIQLYEVLETDHYYYLVMEYCDGGELLDYICTRKRLDEHVARRLVSQLVTAVDGMHKSGVVHRDLKIENFLLNDHEDLKIIDFGLSNTLSQGCMEEYERTGIFPQLLNTHCGSPAYAAPELLAQKKYGPQVDIWSIGINMYAMLTGFLPYMMEPFNVMEMYEKMMQRKMTPIPSFLSQACRDMLMRLLEPVADWRITLKQVMKHKWFTGSEHIPRSIPLGDMMYQKKELCEPVLAYMKFTLKIRTKDTINAVVSNRAVHASAVYHLLVARLDRYLKHKKEKNSAKQFAKLEVIKKSNLSTENVHTTSSSNRSKRFTFRGKKIDSSSRSHPNLGDTETMGDDHVDNETLDLINQTNQPTKHRDINEHRAGDAQQIKEKTNNSTNNLKAVETTTPGSSRGSRGHRRANSSVDAKEYRKSLELQESVRNSLICDSQEDLGKIAVTKTEKTKIPESPKDPFPKSEKGLVTRKQSFDVGSTGVWGASSNGEKNIDVTRFIESPTKEGRRNSNEKQKSKRKMSVDVFDLTEPNVKEQKEPVPGWLITKVVKQPPLKEEHTSILDQEKRINGHAEASLESKKIAVRTVSNPEKLKQKRTIRRPETPDNLKRVSKHNSTDVNNNERAGESSTNNSVSDRIRLYGRQNSNGNNRFRSETPEVEEILRNVRSVNRAHLPQNSDNKGRINKITDIDRLLSTPESGDKWKPPDRETIDNIHDSKTRLRNVSYLDDSDSTISITPSPPLGKESEYSNPDEDLDENNNAESKRQANRPQRSASVDRAQSFTMTSSNGNISPIKTIKISKKTLELNVKQFTQFKTDQKQEMTSPGDDEKTTPITPVHHSSPLKPLQLKFNFQVRKKKAYKVKQQTRSLTDITNGINVVNRKPSEEQMLSPKHRCTETCELRNGECKDRTDVVSAISPDQRREQEESMTNQTSCPQEQEKKTTIKITSHGGVSSTISGGRSTNRTRIFLSAKKTSGSDPINIDGDQEEKTCKKDEYVLKSNNSSFDSGYFGTNPSPPITDDLTLGNLDNSNDIVETRGNITCRKERTKTKDEPIEIHSVKYRCIPVYQPEIVKTATLHGKEALSVINEDDMSRNSETDGTSGKKMHKKWGSQTIEPTQEPVGFLPRSAELISNIKEKLVRERDRKMEMIRKGRQVYENKRLSQNNRKSPSQEVAKVRSQSCKQYPIERTMVGAQQSPRFRRRATFGVINTSRSPTPETPSNSPTVYDAENEKDKVTAFAHALENAAWRKKTVVSAGSYC